MPENQSLESLYQKAKSELTVENLKKISSDIINAYHRGDRAFLEQRAALFLEEDQTGDMPQKKLFLQLVKKFHPDRHKGLEQQLETARSAKDIPMINQLLLLLKPVTASEAVRPVVSYSHTEEYQYGTEDFAYGDSEEPLGDEDTYFTDEDFSDFIQALKEELVGNSGYVLSPVDLEHLDGDLILSNREISDLDGLEYCVNLVVLDLGYNNITRIEAVSSLHYLEELNLSGNDISDLAPLENLKHLSVLELRENDIEDLSSLLLCPELEFVDIRQNPVKDKLTIKELEKRGVVVLL